MVFVGFDSVWSVFHSFYSILSCSSLSVSAFDVFVGHLLTVTHDKMLRKKKMTIHDLSLTDCTPQDWKETKSWMVWDWDIRKHWNTHQMKITAESNHRRKFQSIHCLYHCQWSAKCLLSCFCILSRRERGMSACWADLEQPQKDVPHLLHLQLERFHTSATWLFPLHYWPCIVYGLTAKSETSTLQVTAPANHWALWASWSLAPAASCSAKHQTLTDQHSLQQHFVHSSIHFHTWRLILQCFQSSLPLLLPLGFFDLSLPCALGCAQIRHSCAPSEVEDQFHSCAAPRQMQQVRVVQDQLHFPHHNSRWRKG